MTETDLINAFSALSVNAQAVLAALANYGTGSGSVTITLANGQSYTFQTIPTQIAQWAAQQATDRLHFHEDFGGAVTAQTVTRDTAGRISGVNTTFASGWTMSYTFTRNAAGRIATIAVTISDNLAVVQATFNKTVVYDVNNRFASIS